MGIEPSIGARAFNQGFGMFLDMTGLAHMITQWLWLHAQDLYKCKPDNTPARRWKSGHKEARPTKKLFAIHRCPEGKISFLQ